MGQTISSHEQFLILIKEHVDVFFLAIIMSSFTLFTAWRLGFFDFTVLRNRIYELSASTIQGIDVIFAFVYFIGIQILLVPALIVLYFVYVEGQSPDQIKLNAIAQGWTNLATVVGGVIAVIIALARLTSTQRRYLIGNVKNWMNDLTTGILTWLVSYPLVLALNQIIAIIVLYIFWKQPVDQVAVKHFKVTLHSHFLFWVTAFSVVFVVPFIEETLFRGFLQSWLRNKFKNSVIAILISSVIFTLFHFSSSQGITNIELLISLFVLSCFLGFLYERQRSLFAPMGLHGVFNLISVLMLLFE